MEDAMTPPRLISIGTILACGLLSCQPLPNGLPDVRADTAKKLLERHLPDQPRFVPGEVIAKLKPTISPRSDTLRQMGIETVDRVTSGGEMIYRVMPALTATMR